MKIDAISVTTTDLAKTVRFYELLGFAFPPHKPDEKHLEPITKAGEIRLMIDSAALIESMLQRKPMPPNHSSFALLCKDVAEVDAAAAKVKAAGFTVVKEPWDAFWGQRYAIVADPDGYMIDLFCWL